MPTVTLTFDNGPEAAATPEVLEVLAGQGVLATFFVLGSKAATPEGGDLVKRASSLGHRIGNHTYTHTTPLGELDDASALLELDRTHEVLLRLGIRERLFRPFGRAGTIGTHLLSPAVVEWLQGHHYSCVLWNSVPGDWRDPEGWQKRAIEECSAHEWTVVVLHDLPNGAMSHLRSFIQALKSRGFAFKQDFPPACVPIREGRVMGSLSEYVAGLTLDDT